MTAADKKKISQRSKKGDTLRWNAEKKSGWIYDGTWWRHYRNGKPTRREKERHRISAKSRAHSVVGRAVGMVNPFHTRYELSDKIKKGKARLKAEREQKKKLKLQKDKESVNETLNQKPVKKKQKLVGDRKQYQDLQKAKKDLFGKKKTETKKVKEKVSEVKQNQPKVNTSKTKTAVPKKRLTAREKMRAKNVERHGQARVDHLRAKHADFKKMKKKQISKADFIKKYPKSITAQKAKGLRR